MSGEIWQRFTAALEGLAADVPALARVVPGTDSGDAAGRYRAIRAALAEIALAATESDDDRVSRWLTSDTTAALVTAAATAALEADGLVVDRGMDADEHLRRAVRWRRYGRRTTDDLHRSCAADISRGSLRLFAQSGSGRVMSRLELQRARLDLVRDARRRFDRLRADLLARVPSGRDDAGGFEAEVRRRLAGVASDIRDETDVAVGVCRPAERWPVADVPAPALAQRPDEMWLGTVLGAGFGLGAALGLARVAAGLTGVPDGIGGALGLALGLTLTVAVIGVRARLHRRAVLERWVVATVTAARQACEEELAYRLLEAQAGMASAHHKTKN
ncbi:hypothetical protein [Mycolicibacterium aubagnense]|uniref:hypothetical protein n=1 Tax=Mycolicibacterium aubagnense TaxID=319707 RepID=UPI0010FDB476|nr:hypothetical protein [Mycolicibacterium aubagnense]TLH70838.1 hypothetical protein C1S80_00835 [Mycolicibacterium aubagnense]WGI32675.1 hypothetical protein QDT91_26565 [Mycolicibacterium aubagnense]